MDIFEDLFGEPTKRPLEEDEEEVVFKRKKKNDTPVAAEPEPVKSSSALAPVDDEMADFIESSSDSDDSSDDSSSSSSIDSSDSSRKQVRSAKRTQFDEVLDRMKKPRGKVAEQADSMDELVSQMLSASEKDANALSSGMPALNKLSLLPMVEHTLMRQMNQEPFVDCGGLKALYEWLRLLPDGSLPNLTLRGGVLRLLERLLPSITLESLKESRVGWAVNDTYHHINETSENRRLAYSLISAWLAAVTRRRGDGSGAVKASKEEMAKLNSNHKTTLARNQKKEISDSPRKRANLPRPVSADFRVQPVQKIEPVERRIDSETAIGRLRKKI